jgi:hypothetical protein
MVRTFNRERGGTLGEKALGVTGHVWLEGQTYGNLSILPDIAEMRYSIALISQGFGSVTQSKGRTCTAFAGTGWLTSR